jgi:DhnA family fructose-bisphosphate aldolase class Ia
MKTNIPFIPADVPPKMYNIFLHNYYVITRGVSRLFLFTGDHKIEHTNSDFVGPGIPPEVHDVEHLFRIASYGSIGAFAIHPGLIARYGIQYSHIPYLAKMNAKTNLVPSVDHDPYSAPLASISDVVALQKQSQLNIHGVGYTIYLGSTYEEQMLEDVGKAVFAAHNQGLVVVLWMYPRGHHIAQQQDPSLLAGAAGVGACLGADFVKLNVSHISRELSEEDLLNIMQAAGNTKVIFAGGEKIPLTRFLQKVDFYLKHGAAGIAAGRNIYQNSLEVACYITDLLAGIIYKNAGGRT